MEKADIPKMILPTKLTRIASFLGIVYCLSLKVLIWFYVRLRIDIIFWGKKRKALRFLVSVFPIIYRQKNSWFWNQLSKENLTKTLYSERHLRARYLLEQGLGQIKFNKILEVGCGNGENLHYVRKLYPEANLVGCDFSKRQIEAASQYEGIQFDIADARNLPYEDGEFDAVITVGCLIHIPSQHIAQCARELQRVSRKHLFIFEEDKKFTSSIVYEICKRSGFHFYHNYATMFPGFNLEYCQNNMPDESVGLHTHIYTKKR